MASVPDPWIPVTFQQKDGAIQVGVWGREYYFSKQPLPSQITTAGVELLAQPMRLVAFGERGELPWTQSGCELWERTDEQVTLIGWQVNEALIANFIVRMEFDGFMQVDLTLAPQPKATLRQLWLEVPLRKERASLFHYWPYWPEWWRGLINSGAIAATSITVTADASSHKRHLGDIQQIIAASHLPEPVKAQSRAIFRLLAEAEAKVHGIGVDEVHFHEVGAIDSIVDIVGSVYALHLLGVEAVYASSVPFTRGRVRIAHGELPVPAPATLELLKGMPTYPLDIDGELVTPTGAALLKGLAKGFGLPPPLTPQRIGYGAGKRDLPFPNVLRVVVGEQPSPLSLERERLIVLETNLDDMTGEVAGYVMERLLELGARDVWVMPAQMKKSRPALVLSVLCDPEKVSSMVRVLLAETTTLGVRVREVERLCLPRNVWEVPTPYGTVRVKVATLRGGSHQPRPRI